MTLHERLGVVAGNRSFRELGTLTGTNPETVRRYMRGQAPSVEFVAALCEATGTSAHWLVTGEGAIRRDDARQDALRGADPAVLLAAFAGTVQQVMERLERLETYVQTMEARVRALAGGSLTGQRAEVDNGEGTDPSADRIAGIASAVPQRAPQDAH